MFSLLQTSLSVSFSQSVSSRCEMRIPLSASTSSTITQTSLDPKRVLRDVLQKIPRSANWKIINLFASLPEIMSIEPLAHVSTACLCTRA